MISPKKYYNQTKNWLRRIYRLSLSSKKQENLLWKDLKKLHACAGWNSGIHENLKYIETAFEIGEGKTESLYSIVYENQLFFRVRILNTFSEEWTTDIFLLAAHFNNILNYGIVQVNPHAQYVEYRQRIEIIVPLLYPSESYIRFIRHLETAKDIYWALNKLIYENEPPALIIADLLNKFEKKDED